MNKTQEKIKDIIKTIPPIVSILAATKRKRVADVEEAINAGIKIIGENYVQEAEEKYPSIKGKCKFHLIGPLQKNKINRALTIFDCIQSVDSIELAEEINKRATKPIDILIQVNIGKEPQKGGCMPEEVEQVVDACTTLSQLRVKGLMTIPPVEKDPESTRAWYKKMNDLHSTLKIKYPNLTTLSMGMSSDYRIAVEEGATMIRLGTTLFGARD